MSYCEADNVVMIQSLSFSELCVSILSPVNLTQSVEEQGGEEGKNILHFLATRTTKYHVAGSDWGKNNFMVCPNYSRSCKNTTCGGGQAVVSCNPCDHHNVFPTSPVKIPLYHEPDDL